MNCPNCQTANPEAARAAELGAEAGSAVSDVLEKLEDPELRESFSSLPDVQEVLVS